MPRQRIDDRKVFVGRHGEPSLVSNVRTKSCVFIIEKCYFFYRVIIYFNRFLHSVSDVPRVLRSDVSSWVSDRAFDVVNLDPSGRMETLRARWKNCRYLLSSLEIF